MAAQWLRDSEALWKFRQQVMMSPLQVRGALSERESTILLNLTNGWVRPDRERLYALIKEAEVSGTIVLTGDIHTSWASELSLNPNDPQYYLAQPPENGDDPTDPKGGLAIELITPGVTSRAFAAINDGILNALVSANPQFKFFELTKKGFIELKITEDQLISTWYLMDRVDLSELPGLIKARVMSCQPKPPGLMRLQQIE